MTAFNVVRFRVKPGREKEFEDANRNAKLEATGFRKAEESGYDLVDADCVTADFKLEIGTVTACSSSQETRIRVAGY